MQFTEVRVVLVGTTHPGNIGSTARAMKTMGFENLVLVEPKWFPDVKAFEMAAGADDLLYNARICSSLTDALEGCELVLATSARSRSVPLPELNVKQAAQLIAKQPDDCKVALLFGREHAGLTNDELLKSQYQIQIPTSDTYRSLNLAQAVQILVYELRQALIDPSPQLQLLLEEEPTKLRKKENRLATSEEMEQFYLHLEEVLYEIEFLQSATPNRRILQRLRSLFNRATVNNRELNILRGILTQMQKQAQKD